MNKLTSKFSSVLLKRCVCEVGRSTSRDQVHMTDRIISDFEDGMMLQMLQVHKLFAQGRSSVEGREVLVRAFQRYFDDKLHEDTTRGNLCLVQARQKHNLHHGLHPEDIARTEIGQVAASLSNTTPGAFWMVWHVLSDPVVLADCRREIEDLTTMEIIPKWHSDGRLVQKEICTIDYTKLTDRRACPVLMSTWQEVLRFNHVGISARVVMQDVFLGGYLLKKGSTAMVVSPVMHSDTTVWGSSAREFQHRRFSLTYSNADGREHFTSSGNHDEKTAGEGQRKASNLDKSPAYRNFGGGSTLCPGRHLATQEVLSLVALLVMRFDVHPARGRHWISPRKDVPGPTSMPIPVAGEPSDLRVEMVPRFPGREWRAVFHNN